MAARGLTFLEIVLGVAAGAVAAGGAALILSESSESSPQLAAAADSQTYAVVPFEEVSTVGPQDVVIEIGDTQSVRAEGSRDALSQLEAVVENGRLTIRPKNEFRAGFNWGRLQSATFFVTVPKLTSVALAGSGDVRVGHIEGDRFEGSVAGPGELSIGLLQVDDADLSIAGPGSLVVAGASDQARVSIGGSGEVDAAALKSETATISIGGSGDVALTVESRARISVMGSGDVQIIGPASCSVSRMGSGEVVCNGQEQ
jgi:hypothetical protein